MEDLKQFLSNIQNSLILLKADEPETSQNMVLTIIFFSIHFGRPVNAIIYRGICKRGGGHPTVSLENSIEKD